MKKWLLLFLLLFCSCSSSMPSDPKTDVIYVVAEKVVIKECGKSPCSFMLQKDKSKTQTKYKSEAVLNPDIQTFQARLYTTGSYTWGFGGGIAQVDDGEYLRITDYYPQNPNNPERITVDNITDAYTSEYGSWYRASLVYDLLLIIGVPIGFLIVMGIVIATVNSLFSDLEKGVAFLGTKEGEKLLKKIDKNLRKKN